MGKFFEILVSLRIVIFMIKNKKEMKLTVIN